MAESAPQQDPIPIPNASKSVLVRSRRATFASSIARVPLAVSPALEAPVPIPAAKITACGAVIPFAFLIVSLPMTELADEWV
jgi:hypothetical protein